jgi:hypothetical protein
MAVIESLGWQKRTLNLNVQKKGRRIVLKVSIPKPVFGIAAKNSIVFNPRRTKR